MQLAYNLISLNESSYPSLFGYGYTVASPYEGKIVYRNGDLTKPYVLKKQLQLGWGLPDTTVYLDSYTDIEWTLNSLIFNGVQKITTPISVTVLRASMLFYEMDKYIDAGNPNTTYIVGVTQNNSNLVTFLNSTFSSFNLPINAVMHDNDITFFTSEGDTLEIQLGTNYNVADYGLRQVSNTLAQCSHNGGLLWSSITAVNQPLEGSQGVNLRNNDALDQISGTLTLALTSYTPRTVYISTTKDSFADVENPNVIIEGLTATVPLIFNTVFWKPYIANKLRVSDIAKTNSEIFIFLVENNSWGIKTKTPIKPIISIDQFQAGVYDKIYTNDISLNGTNSIDITIEANTKLIVELDYNQVKREEIPLFNEHFYLPQYLFDETIHTEEYARIENEKEHIGTQVLLAEDSIKRMEQKNKMVEDMNKFSFVLNTRNHYLPEKTFKDTFQTKDYAITQNIINNI